MYHDIGGFKIEIYVKTCMSIDACIHMETCTHMETCRDTQLDLCVHTQRYKGTKIFSYNGEKEVPIQKGNDP